MSDPNNDETGLPRLVGSARPAPVEYRPYSVAISDDTRAQLDVIAKLRNRSRAEEARLAMEHWVEISKNDPELRKLAQRVQSSFEREAAQKEREAEAKRNAFASFFGGDDAVAEPENTDEGSEPTGLLAGADLDASPDPEGAGETDWDNEDDGTSEPYPLDDPAQDSAAEHAKETDAEPTNEPEAAATATKGRGRARSSSKASSDA